MRRSFGGFFLEKILNGFYNSPNTPFFIKLWGFITLYFPKIVFFLQLWGIIKTNTPPSSPDFCGVFCIIIRCNPDLEYVLQANLTAPTRIVVAVRAHIIVGIVEELVFSVLSVECNGIVICVGTGCACIASPFA